MKTLNNFLTVNQNTIFNTFKITFIGFIIKLGVLICIHAINNPHLISM